MEFKNLKRNLNGSIDGDLIREGDSVIRYTLDPAMGHVSKAEAGDWGDIEELDQATKDAHEQAEAARQVEADFTLAIQPLVSGISQLERDTFERQEREAREWLTDNSAPVAFIRGLSESRGVELDILVAKIIIKADYYSSELAKALGVMHKAGDARDAIK
jgi:hypothetical protein|tara:strand:- start:496 stop:975 length:480 start_codon:yes stop_codon:yes gene_type:complete